MCEFVGLRSSHDMSLTRLSAGVNATPGMLVQFTIGGEFCTLNKQDIKVLISELIDVI